MHWASNTMVLVGAVVLGGCAPSAAEDDAGPLRLRFPIAERELILDRVMGVDHDPERYEGIETVHCTNYAGDGFPFCYDDHGGSDFDLINGFETMDDGSATVVAAAAGEVIAVVDDNYDRCHLDPETLGPDCDGYPMVANGVALRHDTGHITEYLHLMQDSALVQVGDVVERGTPLGLVGSSGYSTAPHLHLELTSPEGEAIDPFAGPYSQDESFWCAQVALDGLPASECDGL